MTRGSLRLGAALRLRCPRCLRGPVFAGRGPMHPACPECGLRFEREPGYFLGAMYYSYALSLAAGTPAALLAWWLGGSILAVGLAATAAIAAAAPFTWRLARVLWLHMDQSMDPR